MYKELVRAFRETAVWLDALECDAKLVEYPFFKELHLVVSNRFVISLKVSERRWYVTPAHLRRWASGLLRRGKKLGTRVAPMILAYRFTGGAIRYALRKGWFRLLPLRAFIRADRVNPILLAKWIAMIVSEQLFRRPPRWVKTLGELLVKHLLVSSQNTSLTFSAKPPGNITMYRTRSSFM